MNNKEREEFAVMKNEVTHIKTDVKEIKTMLKIHLEDGVNQVKESDKKYASKQEVKQLEVKFNTWNTNQDIIIKSRGDKAWDIFKKLLPYIGSGIVIAIMTYGPKGI